MIKNFSERMDSIRQSFNSDKNFAFDEYGYDDYGYNEYDYDEYEYDEYEYDDVKFTPEEIDLITKACYIVDNINYALRYPTRGSNSSECTPNIDKSYRVLETSPTNQHIIREIFDSSKTKNSYEKLTTDLSNIMKKIRKSIY